MILLLIVEGTVTAGASFDFTLVANSDDFLFKLFKSISFCDRSELFGFFVKTVGGGNGGGTFLSIEKTALV